MSVPEPDAGTRGSVRLISWDARTVIGLVVSLVAIIGCVVWASKQETPAFPSGIGNWSLLVLALVLYGLGMIVRGWRWDALLRYMRVGHSRADAYALTVVGYMGNTVLPARGGELLRVFLLAERSDALKREVLGSVISERLLDAAALITLFCFVAFIGVSETPGGSLTAAGALALLVIAVAAGFGYLRLRQAGRFESFAERIRPVARASRQLLSFRGAILFLVTLLVWLSEALIFTLCARALDLPVDFLGGLTVTVLASLSALIPAGPGYVGTYDVAALFALGHLGIKGGPALGLVLLYRFVIFVPVTAVGLILMVTRYGGLRGALQRERLSERDEAAGA